MTIRVRWRLATLFQTIVVGALGCGDLTQRTEPAPTANVTASAVDTLFYYYQGQKVFLTEDHQLLVVRGESPTIDAQQELGALGISVIDGGALPMGHRLLRLGGAVDQSLQASAVARLRASRRLTFVSPAFRSREGLTQVLLLDHVDVRFRDGVPQPRIDALVRSFGLRLLRPPRPDSGFFAYRFGYPDGIANPLALAAALDRHDLVQWADPAKVGDGSPLTTPSDPFYSLQFHLKNTTVGPTGVFVDDNVEPAWNLTTGSKSIKVVIVDDGMDWLHQDNMAAQGGGMAYDLMTQYVPPGSGENAYSLYCNDTHGTSIAGLIGAAHNGLGTAGIAPGVTLSIVRMFRRTYPCPGGWCAAGCV